MIRFGVVLAVVVAALGLLVGGILTSSLLLVYLAIGVSALAAVLLVIGVVIWRDEIFNDAAAGSAGRAGRHGTGSRRSAVRGGTARTEQPGPRRLGSRGPAVAEAAAPARSSRRRRRTSAGTAVAGRSNHKGQGHQGQQAARGRRVGSGW